MIENSNSSKNGASEGNVDFKNWNGVGSVSVLAVNPTNAQLRLYGWNISEDADEPKYVTVNPDGKKSARVRFLVQIHDIKEKPVVPMDFWIRPDIQFNKDQTKCQVIDSYGRTAYGTKAEVQGHLIPQYANGPAQISSDYKPAHVGQDNLVSFLMKYLNVTPLQVYSRATGQWSSSKNPGRLTIDNWEKLCNGDVTEIKGYLALQPENRVKVIFGLRTSDDNKTYQTFLPNCFISNGSRVDAATGEYPAARKAIDKFLEHRQGYIFSAAPVKEWKETATEVKDNSDKPVDLPDFGSPEYTSYNPSDLPFEM